ncbi:UvrB/UvrC motif-containing protein [Listeria ivanovii]|uniref:UvrB/UvrC motif-containing protein n=1 Tax=Listeria ivanovii TaxID=1638 RepID=UPI00051284EF|nr:UvrB/UvrC motif-containing protein [Listeria ivanovii]AIS61498.1 excinuclease [Listeria ivanovii subsp. londoniensis]MBK1966075.1 UvrB/UvrC motif-containing protein [Listeria ivanovii subsp. londoniensis]MBK1984230.1 UvrB/UvrC motif-containing protein [Listeria ivanovii subsp. londoniensis]MBK1995292.1 UvrB/UvrC motif-containing protein [Listeria ivanovii subsp. londoniensis]
MICQRCGENKAVIALQQLNDAGKVESLYLCENCGTDEAHASEQDLVKAMDTFSEVALDFLTLLQKEEAVQKKVVCENCHLSFEQFLQTNRVGCEECYSAFQAQLVPIIGRVQNGYKQHIGKVPKEIEREEDVQNEIIRLQEKLNQLIKNEEFEDAAVVRDEIRALKAGGEGK